MRILFTAIMACVFPLLAYSGTFTYECTIKHELQLNSEGQLSTEYTLYVGNTFNVDRKSGLVLGGGLGNSTYKSRHIIDPGGKEQSYTLMWISHPISGTSGGVHSTYLNIEEHNDNLLKPFVLIQSSSVLTGTCK